MSQQGSDQPQPCIHRNPWELAVYWFGWNRSWCLSICSAFERLIHRHKYTRSGWHSTLGRWSPGLGCPFWAIYLRRQRLLDMGYHHWLFAKAQRLGGQEWPEVSTSHNSIRPILPNAWYQSTLSAPPQPLLWLLELWVETDLVDFAVRISVTGTHWPTTTFNSQTHRQILSKNQKYNFCLQFV